jgi:hypothetical protein
MRRLICLTREASKLGLLREGLPGEAREPKEPEEPRKSRKKRRNYGFLTESPE